MKYTNIFEKFICIFNIVKDQWIYLAFLGVILLLLLIANFKKKSKKVCFIMSLLSYIGLVSYIIINYSKQIGVLFDSLMDNLFLNIYFPSVYVYLFILLVIDITTFVVLMNRRGSSIYKWIHSIFFFAIHFILVLILENISVNKIDVFSKASLFSSKDLIMLLEFSVNIFILWIISLVFVYFTNLVTEKVSLSSVLKHKEKEKLYEPVQMNVLTADADVNFNHDNSNVGLENQENTLVSSITTNVEPDSVSNMDSNVSLDTVDVMQTSDVLATDVSSESVDQNVSSVVLTDSNVDVIPNDTTLSDNNNVIAFETHEYVPHQQEFVIPEIVSDSHVDDDNHYDIFEKPEVVSETDCYTLNDYRLFNQMLKDIKEYSQNNTVTIDKNMEYRLITKYSTETYHMFKKMLKIYSN